jgi:hypothetical protein
MQSASPADAGIGHETPRDAESVANTFDAGRKFFWDWTTFFRPGDTFGFDDLGFDAEAPCGRHRRLSPTGHGRRPPQAA